MILTNIPEKIKRIPDLPRDIFLGLVMVLFTLGVFMVSRIFTLEAKRKAELQITTSVPGLSEAGNFRGQDSEGTSSDSFLAGVSASQKEGKGSYVASKTGKTYALPWCGAVKHIKEENRIWFNSKAEAERAGYVPSSNCKGI